VVSGHLRNIVARSVRVVSGGSAAGGFAAAAVETPGSVSVDSRLPARNLGVVDTVA